MDELVFQFRQHQLRMGRRTLLMGILNVTPDSFSDGGLYTEPQHAVAHALAMIEQGADFVDVGGESTRPGAATVTAEQEIARVVPVIKALAAQTSVPISIDTCKAAVADAAIAAGASIVNDVSGLHHDAGMLEVLRETGAGCVLMHMRGTPATMQQLTDYEHMIDDICEYFRNALSEAADHGVPSGQFLLDPGIGFAKTAEQNLDLIRHLDAFRALGRPVLVGPSRKSFIGKLLPGTEPAGRVWGTAGAVACCILRGADVVRVHDVAEMRQVAMVVDAIQAEFSLRTPSMVCATRKEF